MFLLRLCQVFFVGQTPNFRYTVDLTGFIGTIFFYFNTKTENFMDEITKNYINDVVQKGMDGLKATIGQSVQDQSPDIKLLNQALSKAQGQLAGALKDSKNPFYKSEYADLESVWSVAREPLANNGLAITQTPCKDGTHLVTMLLHDSGQWAKGYWPILTAKKDSQGFMASVTYARRGALSALVGIYQTDDDGNESSGNGDSPSSNKKIEQTKSKIGSVKTPKSKSASSEAESDKIVKMVREVMDEGAEKLSEGKVQSLERRVSKLSDENQKKFLHDMSIDACSSLRKDEFTQASKTLSKLERAS